MATLCSESLCATFSGLSKVYRACGYRVGWAAFSGALDRSGELLEAMDLLVAPGSSFNTEYRDHFRITMLADEDTIDEVFRRIDNVLRHMANRPPMLEFAN